MSEPKSTIHEQLSAVGTDVRDIAEALKSLTVKSGAIGQVLRMALDNVHERLLDLIDDVQGLETVTAPAAPQAAPAA